jgi:hypothetical protein
MTFLATDQLAELKDLGYLVVSEVPGLLDAVGLVAEEYDDVLDELLDEMRSSGKLSFDIPRELGFAARMTEVFRETGADYSDYFNIALQPDGVTETSRYRASPAIFRLLREPGLLDVVESVLGSEILATPILYVRLKMPHRMLNRCASQPLVEPTAPHQDNSGLPPEADLTQMLTVWIPMSDVTETNGCIQVWPGSHLQGVLPHRIEPGRTAIMPEALAELGPPVAVPVRYGAVLLMHRRVVHAALPNRDQIMRWSFDLRYQPADQPLVRAFMPSFLARSRAHPELELRDSEQWDHRWSETRHQLAQAGTPQFHRWVDAGLVGQEHTQFSGSNYRHPHDDKSPQGRPSRKRVDGLLE